MPFKSATSYSVPSVLQKSTTQWKLLMFLPVGRDHHLVLWGPPMALPPPPPSGSLCCGPVDGWAFHLSPNTPQKWVLWALKVVQLRTLCIHLFTGFRSELSVDVEGPENVIKGMNKIWNARKMKSSFWERGRGEPLNEWEPEWIILAGRQDHRLQTPSGHWPNTHTLMLRMGGGRGLHGVEVMLLWKWWKHQNHHQNNKNHKSRGPALRGIKCVGV